MNRRMRTIYPHELNKGISGKLSENIQEIPEECWMMQWPKHCDNNNKYENISVSKSIYANREKFVIKSLLHSAIRLWKIGSQLHTTLDVTTAMVFIASRFLQNGVANPYPTSFEFRVVLLFANQG